MNINDALKQDKFIQHDTSSKPSLMSLGIQAFDELLNGGIKKGTMVELTGEEQTGKSTFLLHMVKCAQKHGIAAYIDSAYDFTDQYAKNIGVNTNELLLSQPNTLEETHQTIINLIQSGVDFIAIDTFALLITEKEVNDSMLENYAKLQNHYVYRMLHHISREAKKHGSIVVWVNPLKKQSNRNDKILRYYINYRITLQKEKNVFKGIHRIGEVISVSFCNKSIKLKLIYRKGIE